MPFLSLPALIPIKEHLGRTSWKVATPFVYISKKHRVAVHVPRNFITDLASVPRLPLVWLLVGGSAQAAGAIHDYLYRTGQVSRAVADSIFLEAMADTGVPWARRWAMYYAVRVGGSTAYKG